MAVASGHLNSVNCEAEIVKRECWPWRSWKMNSEHKVDVSETTGDDSSNRADKK